MKSVASFAVVAALCLVVAPDSRAGTVTRTFQVTATIEPYCAVVYANDLAFGSYTTQNITGGLALDASAVFTVTCPQDLPYTIGLDNGLNSPSDCMMPSTNRSMTSQNVPGGNLSYGLYTDENHTIPWGNCTDPDQVVHAVGANISQEFTVYGRIEPGIISRADDYADTVTITVNF